MYLSFYRLHDAPFNITPDPAFLYWTPGHQEAYAALTYGVDAQKGFIALIGEVGCGKTTVLRSFLEQADPERVKAIYLINPEQDFDSVLRTMLIELGIANPEGGTGQAVEALHQYLLDSHKVDRRVVLIVDEAQRMPAETLERLRVLSNLETAKAKLLQIILCGQPELETLLTRDDLRQIRERIAVRAHIGPLTSAQSLACIRHRVVCAGGQADQLFARGALKEIVRRTKGNPRLLNVLCDNALITGFANRERPVTAHTVQDASEAIGQHPERRYWKRLVLATASLCVVAGLVIAGITAKDWLPSIGGKLLATTNNEVVQQSVLPSERPVPPEPDLKKAPEASGAEVVPGVAVVAKSDQKAMGELDAPQTVVPETPVESAKANVAPMVPSADLVKEIPVTAPVDDGAVSSQPSATVPASVPDKPVSPPNPTDAKPELTKPVSATESEPVKVKVTKPKKTDGADGNSKKSASVANMQEALAKIAPVEPETSATAAQNQVWITVATGDNIEKLIKRVNGHEHPNLLKRILVLNPDVADANLIHPGQRVAIPIVPNDPGEAAKRENSVANVKE